MKFGQEFFNTLRSWLGMKEDATEAEVHAKTQEVKDLDDLRSKIRSEVEDQHKVTMDENANKISNLESDLTKAKSALEKANADLTKANARIAELEQIEAEHTKTKGAGGKDTKDESMPVWEAWKEAANA